VQQVFTLPRSDLGAGFPVTWRYKVGLDNLPCQGIRARLKVWGWKYREYGAAIVEGAAPNANLTITRDGQAYKAGLGDGTEKVLVDEWLVPEFLTPGEHTLLFTCGANGAVEALLIVEF